MREQIKFTTMTEAEFEAKVKSKRPYSGKWRDLIRSFAKLPAGQVIVVEASGADARNSAEGITNALWNAGHVGTYSVRRTGTRIAVMRRAARLGRTGRRAS